MMVAAADIAALRSENAALADMAGEDIRELFASLDLEKPEGARDVLLETMPELTTVYGNATSTVAADWYDDIRYTERVPGDFRAVMGEPFPVEFVQKRVRYGAAHLFTETPTLMLPFLLNAMDKYVLQPGRDTVQQSTVRDPQASGWHRETSPGACNFCRMLAGRGGVYKRSTANFAAHGNCGCSAVPSWDADAKEVPVSAYEASEKTYRKSPEQLEAHNKSIREYLAGMDN